MNANKSMYKNVDVSHKSLTRQRNCCCGCWIVMHQGVPAACIIVRFVVKHSSSKHDADLWLAEDGHGQGRARRGQ